MSRYETYKPSGIDWIGDVPNQWHLKRVKDVSLKIVGGGTPDTGNEDYWDWDKEMGIPWVAIADITKNAIITDTEKFITQNGLLNSSAQLIDEGKLLYSIYASLGKVAISGRKLATNQAILSIYENPKRVNVNFLKYYLINLEDIVAGSGSSTTQNNISLEKLRTFKIAIPELSEQLTIANYLDNQTKKIDYLIANKKVQAEKLKELRQIEINNAVTKGLNPNAEMKDSGIEWLGKIPKHWEVKRLKNLVNQVSEKSSEILDDDFLVALENIESHNGKFIETSSEYENNGIKFKKDNLLYNKLRPYLNKVFLADKDGICVGDIIVIECTPKLHPAFLQFRMLSDSFCSIIMSSVYGAKMPRTSWQFISSLKIGYPSFDEQVQIVEYLNERTKAIEGLIQNINRQIEKLQELRKIKIYEAVTGKIKVNAYAETTA